MQLHVLKAATEGEIDAAFASLVQLHVGGLVLGGDTFLSSRSEQLVALGYAGWAPGQLEDEILRNGWLTVQADTDVIFNLPPEERYDAAMHALGVNAANLSEEAGHA